MNTIFRLIVPSVLVVIAASCAKESNSEVLCENVHRYNLSIEQTKTEISGTGDTRQVQWSEGDEIQYYTVSKQASSANAKVSINGSSAYVEIPRGRNDEFINAIYGASQLNSSSSSESTMIVTSPVKNEQRFTSFAEAHVCAAFSDDIENPFLKFHNVAPVFKFSSAASINKVIFHGNGNEIITGGSNGDIKISFSDGAIATEAASTGGTFVTVATNGEESDFFFSVLPVNFANGITIDCYDADNSLIFTKTAGGIINTVSENGTVIILNLGNAQDWIASAPSTAIDLGLSVKWASFNVGATKPEEYGDYFAWGETAPKGEYKWADYQFGNSKNGPFSKYVLDTTYGTADHKAVLDYTDDAAHVAWGDDWRMPTSDEFAELMNPDNCTWTWTTKNGVPGYIVSSRRSGYTANSIFLPANGMKSGTSLSDGGSIGNYWTATISAVYPYYAISPFFDSSNMKSGNCYRYFGLGIRPVQGAVVPVSSITIPETLSLIVGDSETISATVLPENATYKNISWTSSDETIAKVDANGKVTSIAPGTATVTAFSADGGITSTCVVSSNQLAESIVLDKTAIEMHVGDEPVTLTATVLPENNTLKSVTWTSSNVSVATVDEGGRVHAVTAGNATISAIAKDGSGINATCSVTVLERPFARHYLTFISKGETTISLSSSLSPLLYYSYDSISWTEWDLSELVFTDSKPLYICGSNPNGLTYNNTYNRFLVSGDCFDIHGDIMSLLCKDEIIPKVPNNNCFYRLFLDCNGLISAPSLSATTLADLCYFEMFKGCTSLTTAPDLPATTLATSCYGYMFSGCTSLTAAPVLPATTLASRCYRYMFSGCTSLTAAPVLPAITLADYCYNGMFVNCSSLTAAPDLPATTLADHCYFDMFSGCSSLTTAPVLPATTLATSCYEGMFSGCSSLTTAPVLPATTLATSCYGYMFSSCTSLTSAPVLPATTLATCCYDGMFVNCSSLTVAPVLPVTTLASCCYQKMFYGCTSLTTAPVLPATTLEGGCYHGMFHGCSSLTAAPDLPATTLAGSCYEEMFYGCTSLTTAPVLPATTLAGDCYRGMFYCCNSLTSAPDLPATILADYCYYWMFIGCSSLTKAPDLPATTLADHCYHDMFRGCSSLTTAPDLPATTLADYCYYGMFRDCSSLTKAPDLPATTLANYCYYWMFLDCSSLTKAPDLPATTLADYCYRGMFNGCSSLNHIKCLATSLKKSSLEWWVYGVSSNGVFEQAKNANWPRGIHGIPEGWSVTVSQ